MPCHCKVVDKYEPPKPLIYKWSKAKLCRPKDNIKTEKCPRKKSFRPSFDCPKCQPNMTFLMKNEYNHMYETEHADFLKQIQCHEAAIQKKCAKGGFKAIKNCQDSTKPRFIMPKFSNVKAKVDTKGIDVRKNRTGQNNNFNTSATTTNQFFVASPSCYPNFCCRCPRCFKN